MERICIPNSDDNGERFKLISRDFDYASLDPCTAAIRNASAERVYGLIEKMHSFRKMGSRLMPLKSTWAVTSWETLMTRGACDRKA